MSKKPVLLALQSVLCIFSAAGLIVAVLFIYFRGLSEQEYDPMAQIYTTDAISNMAVIVCPVIFAAVIVTIVCAIMKVKDPGAGRPADIADIRENTEDERSSGKAVARYVILALAIIFIVIGMFNGSISDVLIKASKICAECIGLG